MESKDKERLDNTQPEVDVSVGTAADVDEVMKKYDRESNTRVYEGWPKLVVKIIMALFSVYCIYATLFIKGLLEIRLTRFLGLILIIGYLNYPVKKGLVRVNHIPFYDWIIMILGSGAFFYFSFNAQDILMKATRITSDPFMVAVAIVGALALVELVYTLVVFCTGHPVAGWTTTMFVLTVGFAGVFAVLAIVVKYLSLLVDLIFKKQKYLIESVEKIQK